MEIDLGAMIRNYRRIRDLQPKGTEVIAVVKADAYGHGAVHTAAALRREGVRLLAVANMYEVRQLREAGDTGDILVLGAPPFQDELSESLLYTPTLSVFLPEHIRALEAAGGCSVHLKLETGMNRIGARPGPELESVLKALKECPRVRVTGMFSHLSVADEDRNGLTAAQAARFEAGARQVREAGFSPMLHLRNTAADMNGIVSACDAVRLGIGLYGLSPLPDSFGLEPVASWKTRVTYVKTLSAGDTVGYGATWTADCPRRIATLAVGYADGYRRAYAPGDVLIRGKRAPIVGRICMDQLMVDVTGIPDTVPGDESVLIGRMGDEMITASELAERAGTIHYEVLTGVGLRVERRVL